MKKRYSFVTILLVVGLCGCQVSQQPQESQGLKVKILNGDTFPRELAGTWHCAQNKWEVILEENGTVSWILYPLGSVWMEPGKLKEVPMKMDRISTYAAPEVKADYDLETKVFSIDIDIPFFEVAMGDGTLRGNSTDIFTGKMDSKDGLWEAEWISLPTYIVNTPELKDHELGTKEDLNKGTVIFKRYHIEY